MSGTSIALGIFLLYWFLVSFLDRKAETQMATQNKPQYKPSRKVEEEVKAIAEYYGLEPREVARTYMRMYNSPENTGKFVALREHDSLEQSKKYLEGEAAKKEDVKEEKIEETEIVEEQVEPQYTISKAMMANLKHYATKHGLGIDEVTRLYFQQFYGLVDKRQNSWAKENEAFGLIRDVVEERENQALQEKEDANQKAIEKAEAELQAAIEEGKCTPKKVHKIDMGGLPTYNYIQMWMHRINSESVYPEFVFQAALSAISVVTLKTTYEYTVDLTGTLFNEPLYNNIYMYGLAKAGTNKSRVAGEIQKTVAAVMGNSIWVGGDIRPETLQKALCDEQIYTHPQKTGKPKEENEPMEKAMRSQSIKFEPVNGIPHSWKSIWNEEIGGWFSKFRGSTMDGIEQLLCSLYSNMFPPKLNSGVNQGDTIEFACADPFLTIYGVTVPASMRFFGTESQRNGDLHRPDYVYPDYDLVVPEANDNPVPIYDALDMLNDTNSVRHHQAMARDFGRSAMLHATQILRYICDTRKYVGGKFEITFHSSAMDIVRNWELRMKHEYANSPYIGEQRRREYENNCKHCALYTLGNLPYYIVKHEAELVAGKDTIFINEKYEDEDPEKLIEMFAEFDADLAKQYRIEKIVVSPDIAQFACKMHDIVFLPSRIRAMQEVIGDANQDGDMETLYKVLENHGTPVSKWDILGWHTEITNTCIERYTEGLENKEEIEEAIGRAIRDTMERLERIKELPDDIEIRMISKSKLTIATRRSAKKINPLISTLCECGAMIPMEKKVGDSKKETMHYIHIQTNFGEYKLPKFNYVNYTGSGKYFSGVILRRCENPEDVPEEPEVSEAINEEPEDETPKI